MPFSSTKQIISCEFSSILVNFSFISFIPIISDTSWITLTAPIILSFMKRGELFTKPTLLFIWRVEPYFFKLLSITWGSWDDGITSLIFFPLTSFLLHPINLKAYWLIVIIFWSISITTIPIGKLSRTCSLATMLASIISSISLSSDSIGLFMFLSINSRRDWTANFSIIPSFLDPINILSLGNTLRESIASILIPSQSV